MRAHAVPLSRASNNNGNAFKAVIRRREGGRGQNLHAVEALAGVAEAVGVAWVEQVGLGEAPQAEHIAGDLVPQEERLLDVVVLQRVVVRQAGAVRSRGRGGVGREGEEVKARRMEGGARANVSDREAVASRHCAPNIIVQQLETRRIIRKEKWWAGTG